MTLCSVWTRSDFSDKPAALSLVMEVKVFSFTKLRSGVF